jgi:hypothetical protein
MKKTIYFLIGALLLSFGVALAQSSVEEPELADYSGLCCKLHRHHCFHKRTGQLYLESAWIEDKKTCS